MLTTFFRAMILYALMLLALRGLGKHQLGQFQPYEFALAILIADLIATPMGNISTPLLHGVLPVAALFIVHCALTLLSMRSDRFRAFISGKSSVVVSKGVVDKKELDRLCLSLSDLLEGLRQAGILDPSQVGTAVIEADGQLTAFPPAARRAPTTQELRISTEYEGMPMILIMDGRLQPNNLRKTGRDERWLNALLSDYNLCVADVLIASLSTQGLLHIQDMRGGTLSVRAMKAQEVCW